MFDRCERGQIAWDIETTGLGWDDAITVTGFWYPDGHASVILNAGPHAVDADAIETSLEESSRAAVRVAVTADEHGLLRAMRREVFERFDREYNRLVAFNADSWQGGFDLPFVRTRCLQQGEEWLFDNVVFADLWEPVAKRLNTTQSITGVSDEVNTLSGAHTILFGQAEGLADTLDTDGEHAWYAESPYDPFEDSARAVAHYHRGDLAPVLTHNLADIHRTWELGEAVRQFVPTTDITQKKL